MSKHEDRERGIENLLRQRRMETRAADACPDADLLAAWTDGGLHATESASVETHVSNCARCQSILAALVTPIPDAASAAPVSLWRRWQLGWLVPLTAAAAAVVLWVVVPNDAPVPVDQSARVAERPVAIVAEPLRQDPASPPPVQPRAQPESAQPQPAGPVAPAPARSAIADAAPAAQELRREAAPPEQKAAETVAGAAQGARDAQAARAIAVGQVDIQRMPTAPPPPPAASPAAPPAAEPVAAAAPPPPPPAAAPVAAAPPPPAIVAPAPPAQDVRGFSAGGRGAGRGGAPSVVGGVVETVAVSVLSPDPAIRWRLRGASVDLSTNAGASWDPLQSGVTESLTAGSSPSPSVCWVVGRAGVVIVTTDMRTWRRVAFVETSDLTGVQATDAQTATVTTANGRRWRTTNGGASWSLLQDF